MLGLDEIERLLAIGEEQLQELMGVSTSASASVSDTEESGAAPEPPANDGGFSSGLGAGP